MARYEINCQNKARHLASVPNNSASKSDHIINQDPPFTPASVYVNKREPADISALKILTSLTHYKLHIRKCG